MIPQDLFQKEKAGAGTGAAGDRDAGHGGRRDAAHRRGERRGADRVPVSVQLQPEAGRPGIFSARRWGDAGDGERDLRW